MSDEERAIVSPGQVINLPEEYGLGTPLAPMRFIRFDSEPLDPTVVIPPGTENPTDLPEIQLEAGDVMELAFDGQSTPLAEPWTCSESGWYVFVNGTFTKVADLDG